MLNPTLRKIYQDFGPDIEKYCIPAKAERWKGMENGQQRV